MKIKIYESVKNKNDILTLERFNSMLSYASGPNGEKAVYISGGNLAANSIYGASIVSKSITAEQIKAESITGDLIKAGSITTSHITADGIDAQVIKTGILKSIVDPLTVGSSINLDTGDLSLAGGNLTWNSSKKEFYINANRITIGGNNLLTEKTNLVEMINNDPSTTVIDGKKLHFTSDVTMDNAYITKLTTSDLFMENVNSYSINADRITTGNLDISTGLNITNGKQPIITLGTDNSITFNASSISVNSIPIPTVKEVEKKINEIELTPGTSFNWNMLYGTKDVVIGGLSYAAGSQKEYQIQKIIYDTTDITFPLDVTISFDIEHNTANGIDYLQVYNSSNKGPIEIKSTVLTKIPVGKSRQYVQTQLLKRTAPTTVDNYIEFYSKYGTSHWYKITNLKIETGFQIKPLWAPHITETKGDQGVPGPQGATGPKGSDGISPIVGFLTNESITLPASSAGVVSSFTGATGTFEVYHGTTRKTGSGVVYSVSGTPSGITVSINATTGVYTVSAMTTGASVLSGTATLRAVYGGVTVDKILTVTKALAGTQGLIGETGATGPGGKDATIYWINASTNAIKKDVTGTIVPSTVTFSGFSKTGTSNPVAYAGSFIIQTSTDGVSYTTAYTSSANQSSYTYTIPTTASFVKAKYYLAGGTSILLDEQTVPVLVDAEGIEVGGTNLIVQSKITRNKYLTVTGAEVGSTGWFFTDYINVKDYKNLIASGYSNLGTAPSVVYYNSEKVMTRAIANGSKNLGANITLEPGEEFIRFSGMIVDLPTIKLEKGNIATDWSPAPEDIQSSIDSKADSEATEQALNEATALLQTLQQEVRAAALDGELKDFIVRYNKEQKALDADKKESNKRLQEALNSISLLTNNMGDMSETWNFVDRYIKNTPQGIVVGNHEKGSYILIKEDRLSFFSNNEEVAFIAQNLMEISRGAFVEQIQISQYIFEKYGTNQLVIRYAG